MSDRPPLTDEELAVMEARARLVGCANCWTGTGGSVAADNYWLIREVRRLRAESVHTPCRQDGRRGDDDEHGGRA